MAEYYEDFYLVNHTDSYCYVCRTQIEFSECDCTRSIDALVDGDES
jgi:hypothetical protein